MKIKNIAFYGVMASILAVGAARADDDNQIIASKAYVDAKVWANAQEQADWIETNTSAKSFIKNKPTLFSGSYNDLTDKPTIPDAQVNSDWNASSGVTQILNKPTINTGTLSTSSTTTLASEKTIADAIKANSVYGTYDSNETYDADTIGGAIQAAGEAQVQSNWAETDSTKKSFILNKPSAATANAETNKVVTGVTTENGSVKSVSSSQIKTDMIEDSAVTFNKVNSAAVASSITTDGTASSTKLATEKAVADAISGKENSTNKSTTGLITAVDANDQITTISAGTDTAYASTSAISSDLTKVKNALAKKQGLLGGGTSGTLLTNSGTAGTVNSTTVVKSTVGNGDGIAATLSNASDDKIPTEKAVKEAIDSITFTVDETYDGTSANAQAGTAVAGALGTLDYAGVDGSTGRVGAVTNLEDEGKAVVEISQSDGIVSARLGTVGTKGIANDAVTSAKIANNAVTTDKIADDNVTFAKVKSTDVVKSTATTGSTGIAADPTNASDSKLPTEKAVAEAIKSNSALATYNENGSYTSGTIGYAIQNAITDIADDTKTADTGKFVRSVTTEDGVVTAVTSQNVTDAYVDANADIAYSKMNKALPNINTPSTAYVQGTTCTDSAPCVLSFNGTAYTWTNMDLAN